MKDDYSAAVVGIDKNIKSQLAGSSYVIHKCGEPVK
jgi:hypothetical protein